MPGNARAWGEDACSFGLYRHSRPDPRRPARGRVRRARAELACHARGHGCHERRRARGQAQFDHRPGPLPTPRPAARSLQPGARVGFHRPRAVGAGLPGRLRPALRAIRPGRGASPRTGQGRARGRRVPEVRPDLPRPAGHRRRACGPDRRLRPGGHGLGRDRARPQPVCRAGGGGRGGPRHGAGGLRPLRPPGGRAAQRHRARARGLRPRPPGAVRRPGPAGLADHDHGRRHAAPAPAGAGGRAQRRAGPDLQPGARGPRPERLRQGQQHRQPDLARHAGRAHARRRADAGLGPWPTWTWPTTTWG